MKDSKIISNSTNTTESTENDAPNFIIGDWNIKSAKHGITRTDYPLQYLYGTGIKYGGTLTLNKDNTFTKYIGITGETSENEGSYSLRGNTISFKFDSGRTEEAMYLPSSREIEYHTQDVQGIPVYEYFTKTENKNEHDRK